jgi:hypothetical protein
MQLYADWVRALLLFFLLVEVLPSLRGSLCIYGRSPLVGEVGFPLVRSALKKLT